MLKPKDAAEAERIFSALAEDGTVQLPIAETFLGAAVRHGRRSIRGAVVDQLRETHGMKNTEAGKSLLAIKAKTG